MNKIPILIIDDDEVDRYILKRHLAETGLDVVIYEEEDGKSALNFLLAYEENRKRFEDYPPVLIFLDVNMPLMNGFEFLDEFANIKSPNYSDLCVLMMFTSSAREEDRVRSEQFGFVKDYLVKGEYDLQSLRESIERHVGA